MRLSYSKEDLLIGFFIIFGISYPFIMALLIFLEDVKAKKEEMEELKAFYSLFLGLEECKEEKAKEVSRLMSEELYKTIGGVEGLLSACQSYRKAYTFAKAEEKIVGDGQLLVELIKKEKGMTQRLASVRIYFEGGGEGLRITKVEYEKGR
ncbi:MAG: hypothetical protein ACK4OF_01455 [Aquificaceae bacterium]